MAVQYAAGAVAFADFLQRVKDRLVAVLTIPADPDPLPVGPEFVRVLASPAETEAGQEFRAERGVTIRVGPAVPQENSGAGRSGWRVERYLNVYVVSVNLLDFAGDDLLAIKAHLIDEEAVVDAVVDSPPAGEANALYQKVLVTWVPGGSGPFRRSADDFGTIQSSVRFKCVYPAKLKINRDGS